MIFIIYNLSVFRKLTRLLFLIYKKREKKHARGGCSRPRLRRMHLVRQNAKTALTIVVATMVWLLTSIAIAIKALVPNLHINWARKKSKTLLCLLLVNTWMKSASERRN